MRELAGHRHVQQAHLRKSVMMMMLVLLRLVCTGRWRPKVSIQERIVDVAAAAAAVEQKTV